MNTKILVCCHKQAELPHDTNFMPIHVGKKLSKQALGMTGDDSGDNISELNPFFCELTAQYWAWKNLTGVDTIGLCHYRRFFKFSGGVAWMYYQQSVSHNDIDTSLIPKLLEGYDIIMPKPATSRESVFEKFSRFMTEEQTQIYLRVFLSLYTEYENMMLNYLNGNKSYNFNMAVMPWDLFCQYNEFLFSILFKARKYIKTMPYAYYNRTFGMFSEILLPVFVKHNKLRMKNVPVIFIDDNQYHATGLKKLLPKQFKSLMKDRLNDIKFWLSKDRASSLTSPFWDAYLANDGIRIE